MTRAHLDMVVPNTFENGQGQSKLTSKPLICKVCETL